MHGHVGYRVKVATDREIADPQMLRDVKGFLRRVGCPRRKILDWLSAGLRDSTAELVDEHGNRVEIDFEELERDHIDLWFRDWVRGSTVSPKVRQESRERIRVLISILRVIFPKESLVWGVAPFNLPVLFR